MRLVCPNCDAKYEVPDDAIPEGGRDVQCSGCGHAWFQMRPEAEIAAEEEAALFGDDLAVTEAPQDALARDVQPETTAVDPDPAPADTTPPPLLPMCRLPMCRGPVLPRPIRRTMPLLP